MPRRTREEKIIAELRRKLKEQAPVPPSAPVSRTPVTAPLQTLAQPERVTAPAIVTPVRVSETRTYLKYDLTKLGLIALGAIGFEAAMSYLILSGVLKPLGIT